MGNHVSGVEKFFNIKSIVAMERVQYSTGSTKLERIGKSLKYTSDNSESLLIEFKQFAWTEKRSTVSKIFNVDLKSSDDGFDGFKSLSAFKLDPMVFITSKQDDKETLL